MSGAVEIGGLNQIRFGVEIDSNRKVAVKYTSNKEEHETELEGVEIFSDFVANCLTGCHTPHAFCNRNLLLLRPYLYDCLTDWGAGRSLWEATSQPQFVFLPARHGSAFKKLHEPFFNKLGGGLFFCARLQY